MSFQPTRHTVYEYMDGGSKMLIVKRHKGSGVQIGTDTVSR